MKRNFTLSVFILLTGFIYAQTMSGFVTNPGFEDAPDLSGWELVLKNDAAATLSIVTSAEDSSIPEGTKAIKVVVTNTGTGNQTDIILKNTSYLFTDYYTVPEGDVNLDFSWKVKRVEGASAGNAIQPRINEVNINKSVSTPKAVAEGWNSFSINKTFTVASHGIDYTNLELRADIALAYKTGTYIIDDITSSVTGAVTKEPTAIGDVGTTNIKVWSTNKTIKIDSNEFTTGRVSVYNIAGKEITNQALNQGENTIEIALSGLFIIKTTINNNIASHKVLVK